MTAQALKTECPAGHVYDEANTYVHVDKEGRVARHCRQCMRDANKRHRDSHVSART